MTEELAAKLHSALALHDVTGGGGMSATVMTAEGTWSGTTGKADGVQDLQVDAVRRVTAKASLSSVWSMAADSDPSATAICRRATNMLRSTGLRSGDPFPGHVA